MSIATLTTNYRLSKRKGQTKINEGWKKPPEGMLKINIDASFDIDAGSGESSICRDNSSQRAVFTDLCIA
uniref:Uncharacterized protein n=1 Tax=Leersia perrieri TaxID=77586 RepID=A0A0D9WK41_9ORYZ